MAFKKITKPSSITDTPDKLLLDLPRRKIPNVFPHQSEIMKAYTDKALDAADVALQLPTGSGKTLVGLLIGEWLRRKNNEKVVYLCPTQQLVNQAVEQARDKYGIDVQGFTGSAAKYDQSAKAKYENADCVAITTYSSLFNVNPYFKNADVLIIDDAHAAEAYISKMWSVSVNRDNSDHVALHAVMQGILRPHIDPNNFTRLSGAWNSSADQAWVDKIPTPVFMSIKDDIISAIDVHAKNSGLEYEWSMIRDHLDACHLYISSHEMLIRPLIPPTWTHAAFSNPRQRIFMSATLGSGGDLERLTGRHNIVRLPVSEGWDQHGVGRRFFVFPGMSLDDEEIKILRKELMIRAGRSLVLVPSTTMQQSLVQEVKENTDYSVFEARDIEKTKFPFISYEKGVAIVANRYDGIDFPGNECRLLFIEGLPKAINLQERFIMSRMASNVLYNERVQTRVFQAIGRCTRSLEDFSAVIVTGEELQSYLADNHRRKFMHPELQAEINFGIEQSKDSSLDDMVENFEIFIKNGKEWENTNQNIVEMRQQSKQELFPSIDDLSLIVNDEIEYQAKLWQGNYEASLDFAEHILGKITSPGLQGYRALWYYLAGSAAWLGSKKGGPAALELKAKTLFGLSRDAATGISWLVALARYNDDSKKSDNDDSILMEQIERVESVLENLGTVHDRDFAKREKKILEGLDNENRFEEAHKLLGELLGFNAEKVESEGSPDPWWISGNFCLVFEDYVGAQENSPLSVTKARQATSHPAWIARNVPACENAEILAVLISPITTIKSGAIAHAKTLSYWEISDFRAWSQNAIQIIRKLRTTFVESGDLEWRTNAVTEFKQNKIDAIGLFRMLQSRRAVDILKEVG